MIGNGRGTRKVRPFAGRAANLVYTTQIEGTAALDGLHLDVLDFGVGRNHGSVDLGDRVSSKDSPMFSVDTVRAVRITTDGTIGGPDYGEEDQRFLRGWHPIIRPVTKDVKESERVALRIGALSRQCWFNSRKAIMRLADYAEASYVEGHALSDSGWALEHGWIIRGDRIIDPTLPDGIRSYHAGLEFPGREGIVEFLATPQGSRCKKSPFFHAFGWAGHLSPSFADARRACEGEMFRSIRGTSEELDE